MNKKYIDFVPVSKVKNTTNVKQADSKVRIAKKQKVGGVKVVRRAMVEKKSEVTTEMKKTMPVRDVERKSEIKIPKVQFINQEKVTKRPLSKNVYVKKAEKIEPQPEENIKNEPVVIVEGKKKSKVGTIIAIIIAMVLGAVAGTVVFFLLPK